MNQLYAKKGGVASKLDNPNLVLAAGVAGVLGLLYYNQMDVKHGPTPDLAKLTARPDLKVGDVKDVDAFVDANLDKVSLAAQQKPVL